MLFSKNISSALSGFVHLFYPRLCEGCSRPLVAGEEVLCLSCSLELPKTDYHHVNDNDTAMRFAGRIPYSHATSFAYFTNAGLLQHLLHGLKYKNKKETGRWLGKQFGLDLARTGWIAEIDGLIPVPLHRKKEAQRGYNQSLLIAEGLAEVLHTPILDKALTRGRHTESQTKKSRAERMQNMQDAFVITQAEALEGKHLLLIDDVLTTGATLESCALTLLKIPGVKVSFATIGIAMD
ncbi:MAG: ComF family protein [Bacteroidetes bacterium]|nr:ComF family protein [Bacteroidota bacterium]